MASTREDIIDLTRSSPEPDVKSTNNILPNDPEQAPTRKSKSKKKRSREQSPVPADGQTTPTARNNRRKRRSENARTDAKLNDREDGSTKDRQRTSPKSRRRRARSHSRSPRPVQDAFYIDITPASIPVVPQPTLKKPEEPAALLLPAHVSVFGAPVEILRPPTPASDEEDYIQYLDTDDRRNIARYYDASAEKQPTLILCKHCGEEGDHKASACKVLICLTCGVRGEHPTYSCPISKTCFRCGMKGHINVTCPNARSRADFATECTRCGSREHLSNECPTLWRMYDYVTDEERKTILKTRDSKRHLALGEGGEGYIADDDWCYNCGGHGHMGDDCQEVQHPSDFPHEPSAFGLYNMTAGPFYDPTTQPTPSGSRHRELREWEVEYQRWGKSAPQNVGRAGRQKNAARMGEMAKQLIDDDPDDWFGNQKNVKNHGSAKPPQAGPKKLIFNKDNNDRYTKQTGGSLEQGPSPRRRDSREHREHHHHPRELDRKRKHSNKDSSRDGEPYRDREHRDKRNRDKDRGSDHRPKYNGGYHR